MQYWCVTSYLHQEMRPSAGRLEITVPSLAMTLFGPLSQQKRCTTLHGTQTERNDLLFTSVINLSFTFFYYLWLEAGMYFSLENFSTLCLWSNKYCANKCFFNSLPQQMLVLDKIFITVSSTAFVHTCCCNQHKMKVPHRDFKKPSPKVENPFFLSLSLSLLCFF